MKKIFRTISYLVFALIFIWVAAKLFLKDQVDFDQTVDRYLIEDLRVIYPDDALSLEPTSLNPAARLRILNIYEPLVKTDRDLNFEPGLALSWGMVDDLTWAFELRSGVKFHDGSDFTVEDVEASIERARSYRGSELVNFVDSIDAIEFLDDLHLRLHTKKPDPLLLLKLSNILMIPSEEALDELPVGTGSYVLRSREPGILTVLERFDGYWGELSQFETVHLLVKRNKSERVNSFLTGDADLLAFVPFDAAKVVEEKGFEISSMPSLEVQFLLFNFDSKIFKSLERRKVVSLAIDQNTLVEAVGGYARPVNQFVSNGIFGFNPEIAPHEYDLEKARQSLAKLEGKTVQVHLPLGLDILGEHIRQQLVDLGMKAVISYLDTPKLLESFSAGKADIYFLAFRASTGDGSEFLKDVMASSADFNIANYSDQMIDQLIADSDQELDPAIRLEILQRAMKKLDEDVVGVPLFEYETLYAFSNKILFEPRIDGVIYFDDLTKR